jgi:predicted Zn finger-like uncharacterized protein
MSTIVDCPSCNRKLRVPDELLGQQVKCPTCSTTFAAAREIVEPAAPPTPTPTEPTPGPAPENEPRYELDTPPRRPPVEEEDEDIQDFEERRPRRRRRRLDYQPHRGVLILVLGILGLTVCGLMGPVAWTMGNQDLQEIRAGRMDPDGEGLTQGGRICGMIATGLLVLSCCFIGLMFLAGMAGGMK